LPSVIGCGFWRRQREVGEKELGKIIELADQEPAYEMKARRFLQLLKGGA
jgi:hypothetical protein